MPRLDHAMKRLFVALLICLVAGPSVARHHRHHRGHGRVPFKAARVIAPPKVQKLAHGAPRGSQGPSGMFSGSASWYGPGFNGKKTACGVTFRSQMLIAAHRTLPCGTILQVVNKRNGKRVNVTVMDRGPFVGGRIIDLSQGAAEILGFRSHGTAEVDIQRLN